MDFPADLKYSKEHEWVRVSSDMATLGITDYAQEQLGDVVMVELPTEGSAVKKDETFGVVESVKSVSDVFSPVSGSVVEVNSPLSDSPGCVNEDCYGEGWIVKIKMSDVSELDGLMDATAYQSYLEEA